MGLFDWIVGTAGRDAGIQLLPQVIELPAVDSRWTVAWEPDADARLIRSAQQQRLTLTHGRALDAIAALQHWLKAEGRRHLPDWLALVAADTGHRYTTVSVRLQRSRWGSCSSSGRISLNAKLLMLPPDAVRYVLVHELAHTVHMNHSRAFWSEVARHQPDWREQVRVVKAKTPALPAWVHAHAKPPANLR